MPYFSERNFWRSSGSRRSQLLPGKQFELASKVGLPDCPYDPIPGFVQIRTARIAKNAEGASGGVRRELASYQLIAVVFSIAQGSSERSKTESISR
jgi:hypothetical protein